MTLQKSVRPITWLEKRQQDERARRDVIPEGECVYFDEAYERGMKLLSLELADLDREICFLR